MKLCILWQSLWVLDRSGAQNIALISKQLAATLAGGLKKVITDADNFRCTFPLNLSVTTKSLSTWGSHSYRKFVYHIKWAAGFASMTTKLSNQQTNSV